MVEAFRAIKRGVGECFDRLHQPGTYVINVGSAADGSIEQVCVDGDGAAESSACIEGVARTSLRLPASGAPYSIAYPFILR